MVSLICKLATEVMQCVVQDNFFFWCLLDEKELFLFYFKNFFCMFKTKILQYIFMTIFIFYEALKKSRVFLLHLIQLSTN